MKHLVVVAALLLLTGCQGVINHPSQWATKPTQVTQLQMPPTYRLPTKNVCYDKWGNEITPADFRAQGYGWRYGDHCWEVGLDPRPRDRGRGR